MEFREAAEAVEKLKQFCKENNYTSDKEKGCCQCPFMGEEQCIFTLSAIPMQFDIKKDRVDFKEEW